MPIERNDMSSTDTHRILLKVFMREGLPSHPWGGGEGDGQGYWCRHSILPRLVLGPAFELLAGDQTAQFLLSHTSLLAQGSGEGDDRSRQFQNVALGQAFPWQYKDQAFSECRARVPHEPAVTSD